VLIPVLALRVAYGAALLAAPDKLTKRWLGPIDEPAEVALRGLGAREIALHGLAIAAARGGHPVRPFLYASIAGDLSDIASTLKARYGLPKHSPAATVVVAGASAAITAALLISGSNRG
jgi:hypothetical protein